MTVKVTDWGPHGWKFIHYVSMFYPSNPTEEDKENYKTFLTYIGKVLPCKSCNEHYNQHLEIFPLSDEVLSNNINLTKWSIDMHNQVNKLHGEKIYDYDEAIELIKKNFNCPQTLPKQVEKLVEEKEVKEVKEKPTKNNTTTYILLLLILFIIAAALIFKPNNTETIKINF
jgi:hypothetical protein